MLVRAEQVEFGVHQQGLAVRDAVAHLHDVGLERGERGVPAERRQPNRGEWGGLRRGDCEGTQVLGSYSVDLV